MNGSIEFNSFMLTKNTMLTELKLTQVAAINQRSLCQFYHAKLTHMSKTLMPKVSLTRIIKSQPSISSLLAQASGDGPRSARQKLAFTL
jgi:hypothetical protein